MHELHREKKKEKEKGKTTRHLNLSYNSTDLSKPCRKIVFKDNNSKQFVNYLQLQVERLSLFLYVDISSLIKATIGVFSRCLSQVFLYFHRYSGISVVFQCFGKWCDNQQHVFMDNWRKLSHKYHEILLLNNSSARLIRVLICRLIRVFAGQTLEGTFPHAHATVMLW